MTFRERFYELETKVAELVRKVDDLETMSHFVESDCMPMPLGTCSNRSVSYSQDLYKAARWSYWIVNHKRHMLILNTSAKTLLPDQLVQRDGRVFRIDSGIKACIPGDLCYGVDCGVPCATDEIPVL